MKRFYLVIIIFLISFSQAFPYTGEAGPPMLKMIYGPRILALGGAFVGLSDDIYYLDSNPAGGDRKKIYKLSLLHQEWIADVNYEAFRFSFGFRDRFFGGLGFTYLYLPFTYYDYYGVSDGKTYTISQSLGVINGGYNLARYDVSLGANLKLFYNNVPETLYAGQRYFLFATDLGVLVRTKFLKGFIGPEPSLILGLAMKNIGFSREIEKLPMEIHAGASYRVLRNLLFAAELALPLFEPVYGSLGVEYDYKKQFFLEGGIQIKRNPMLALGIGYKRKDLQINASYTPSVAFYNMMGVSISYSLGKTKEESRERKIEELLIKALDYYREGKYESALDLLNRILEIDPSNKLALSLKETITLRLELEKELEGLQNQKEE